MNKRKRPPWWFTSAIWAGLAGAAMIIVGALTLAAP